MLKDFFNLNEKPTPFESQDDFLQALKTSDSLHDFLYRPDFLQPSVSNGHPKLKIKSKTFKCASFSKTTFRNIIFSKCNFIDCLLIGAQLENCELHDCKFQNVNTHKIKISKTYVNPDNFKEAILNKNYSNIAVHLFQQIYDNLNDEDQPILAKSAEYYFLDWERINIIQKFKNKEFKSGEFFKKIFSRQLHYFVGYGIKFTSFFKTYLAFLILFGIVNYFMWDSYSIKTELFLNQELHTVLHIVYFTFYTTTSLGAGEMFPQSDIGIFLAILQSLIGYVFIGVFLSMLIKKIIK